MQCGRSSVTDCPRTMDVVSTLSRRAVVEEVKPRAIWQIDTGGLGRWEEFRVYWHPVLHNRFAVSSQRGCSCWTFEDPTEEFLAFAPPLDLGEVRRALGNHLMDSIYRHEAHQEIEYFDRLMMGLREAGVQ